jgi:hypothetical protein
MTENERDELTLCTARCVMRLSQVVQDWIQGQAVGRVDPGIYPLAKAWNDLDKLIDNVGQRRDERDRQARAQEGM